ncbi:acetylornithine aminotransferase, mitochondrial precursor [Lodderomyces elongisporus NRRL YB-4239]|uniref:Acetylornithine aminotransferase, mitochondrial n=1 Tax=Lodderomyces elongisporus (strain ATCC 11503 / CBS 2605 / JCM 1781 / NBRC 1676 / NRRL YB-4239) TaxID=379508 RepID=A5E4B1_LODEL|nr:acetylornithine aminotransferase, mitochondrial precursor [Lodderomyces elongisporus NRRL YB-4239]
MLRLVSYKVAGPLKASIGKSLLLARFASSDPKTTTASASSSSSSSSSSTKKPIFEGIPDAGDDSHSGEYIKTVSKPYTVTTYARPNLVLTHGKGSHIYDLEDRKYIDFTSGIAVTCLGHANEEISKIIQDQSQKLLHCSNLYYNLPAGELANKLVTKTRELDGMSDAARVFLCNSGTEANEAAMKFARKYGKMVSGGSEEKVEFITFENSFHGRSLGALSLTPNPKYQKPFAPLIPGVNVAKPNNIESVKQLISRDKTCAVIIEPIQGEGGVNPIDGEFLVQLRQLCDENDVVLIYDEIQCGLGRSGKLWAHSHLPKEAHPDIVTMAKALGNGFPIGATMITERIENALAVGDHGTTYGGNPLGSRIGSYVVDQIANEEFLAKVNEKSNLFTDKLEKLANEFPEKILKVKGKGLLLGLQFDEKVDINKIVEKCRENGLLIITAGLNTVRLVPALNIPEGDITEGLAVLEHCIRNS